MVSKEPFSWCMAKGDKIKEPTNKDSVTPAKEWNQKESWHHQGYQDSFFWIYVFFHVLIVGTMKEGKGRILEIFDTLNDLKTI